jgi:hypothetical protein
MNAFSTLCRGAQEEQLVPAFARFDATKQECDPSNGRGQPRCTPCPIRKPSIRPSTTGTAEGGDIKANAVQA